MEQLDVLQEHQTIWENKSTSKSQKAASKLELDLAKDRPLTAIVAMEANDADYMLRVKERLRGYFTDTAANGEVVSNMAMDLKKEGQTSYPNEMTLCARLNRVFDSMDSYSAQFCDMYVPRLTKENRAKIERIGGSAFTGQVSVEHDFSDGENSAGGQADIVFRARDQGANWRLPVLREGWEFDEDGVTRTAEGEEDYVRFSVTTILTVEVKTNTVFEHNIRQRFTLAKLPTAAELEKGGATTVHGRIGYQVSKTSEMRREMRTNKEKGVGTAPHA
ncbi:hypothetical protein PHLCEN_2v9491 [Hermanssonia centrifuga]|uniref:Uncharacterized protein n=1 Tax=Hermanssonia centrifuga TaxID=98765 RepID=A0A2R6NQM4_9APHY|nr:hypothetical protein PHLCEN_2v9491 [Hermanssonia centrifuga]